MLTQELGLQASSSSSLTSRKKSHLSLVALLGGLSVLKALCEHLLQSHWPEMNKPCGASSCSGRGLYGCPKQALWQEEGSLTLHLSGRLLEHGGEVLAPLICGAVGNDAGWQCTLTSTTALVDWAAPQSLYYTSLRGNRPYVLD